MRYFREKQPLLTHKDLDIWKIGIDLVEMIY